MREDKCPRRIRTINHIALTHFARSNRSRDLSYTISGTVAKAPTITWSGSSGASLPTCGASGSKSGKPRLPGGPLEMASPHKRTAARGVGGGSGNDIEAAKLDAPRAKFRKGAQLDLEDAIAAAPPRVRQKERRSGQALAVIATINKSHCSQLRVSISQWRDSTRSSYAKSRRLPPGIYMPTTTASRLRSLG